MAEEYRKRECRLFRAREVNIAGQLLGEGHADCEDTARAGGEPRLGGVEAASGLTRAWAPSRYSDYRYPGHYLP